MTADTWVAVKVANLKEKYKVDISYNVDLFDNTYTILCPKILYYNPIFLIEEQTTYKEFFNLFPYVGLFFVSK